MARKHAKQSWLQNCRQRWADLDPALRARWMRRTGRGALGLLAMALAAWAFLKLERQLLGAPTNSAPARMIVMHDRPAHAVESTDAVLVRFARTPWTSPTLCKDIAEALAHVSWVKDVVSVHRFPDRRIEVRCNFRPPAALVQKGERFYLVDPDGVRLPGEYINDPAYFIVQGVGAQVPEPGKLWPGDDLRAGLNVVRLLRAEPYREQITGILVHNFAGREDPRRPHILLATDRSGGRIVWGSEPGKEIEEVSIADKLVHLRNNFEHFGRVDANRAVIDISVYSNRIIVADVARG